MSSKMAVVRELVDGGVTVAQACRDVGISKTSYYKSNSDSRVRKVEYDLANLVYKNALTLLGDMKTTSMTSCDVVASAFIKSMKALINYDDSMRLYDKLVDVGGVIADVKEPVDDVVADVNKTDEDERVKLDKLEAYVKSVVCTFKTSAKTVPMRKAALRKFFDKKDLSCMDGVSDRYDLRCLMSDLFKLERDELLVKYSSMYCPLIDYVYDV